MRLARIGADGLDADAEDVTLLGQKRHALWMKPRRVRAVRTGVQEFLGALAMRPVRADEYPGVRGDAAMLSLPLLHDLAGQQEVGIRLRLRGDIDHTGGTDETVHRNIVRCVVRIILAGHPMDRGIEMRAGMLTAGDVVPVPGRSALVVMRDLLEGERLRGREL